MPSWFRKGSEFITYANVCVTFLLHFQVQGQQRNYTREVLSSHQYSDCMSATPLFDWSQAQYNTEKLPNLYGRPASPLEII